MKKEYRFETLAVHGGHKPDPVTNARGVPVWRTSSYIFNSAEHGANLFALKEPGNIYSRLGDPTNQILENRIALLEGGAAAVTTASGTAAIHYTVITIAKQGDEIVAASNLYGGTYTMFDAILPDQGIQTRFVDVRDPENFRRAITPKTKLLYVETIGNPSLDVADIPAIADIAHENGIPLVVDNTFASPYLYRPIENGADIVIESLTKWIGGHGAALGGIAVDAGKFNWANGKFPAFTDPDPNYHGMRWATDLPGELKKTAFAMRFRTVPLRNLGACLSPDNAWIFIQGAETLGLRMERHCSNALRTAEFLRAHPKTDWVRYPGLPSDPSHAAAKKLLKGGFGGVVVFGVKGGREAGQKFIESLSLFSRLANVGDTKSLALHPASTSHSQLSDEQQREAGLNPGLVRLSVGIEHIDDILQDIEHALARC